MHELYMNIHNTHIIGIHACNTECFVHMSVSISLHFINSITKCISSVYMYNMLLCICAHTPIQCILHLFLQYMGSTPIILTGNASAKTARMQQAQQVVKLFKVGAAVYTTTVNIVHILNK